MTRTVSAPGSAADSTRSLDRPNSIRRSPRVHPARLDRRTAQSHPQQPTQAVGARSKRAERHRPTGPERARGRRPLRPRPARGCRRSGSGHGHQRRRRAAPAASAEQRSCAYGQRGWNAHPVGGWAGSATSPTSTGRLPVATQPRVGAGECGQQTLGVRVPRTCVQLIGRTPVRRSGRHTSRPPGRTGARITDRSWEMNT